MTEAALPLPQGVLSVTQLTRYVRYVFEQDHLLSAISVRGEVCEFSRSPSGHVYLSIKDSSSQISCVLFRREALQQPEQTQELRKGVSVVVHGYLTLYEPRGSCQIYVERVVVEGEGAFALRFERLKAKLEAEGLFAADRKRPIPRFPRAVALITSPRGQAYHDVLHRLEQQYPFVRVIQAGASVQGDGAADEMVLAIDIVNRLTDADIILLVRGGGSPEDLAAFNEERLARAVFSSRIPVITGVGHELDFTIVDFVADQRAATPSLAAAAAVPDIGTLVQRAAQLHGELTFAAEERLRAARRRWIDVNRALLRASPQTRLRLQRQRADELNRTAHRSVGVILRTKRARLNALEAQLKALDPLAILARGYAVLTDRGTGRVVSTIAHVTPNKALRAQVSDGEFDVRTEGT
ncbi:MAG TPA: exodeoxyribonuclease VII large subunit [Chloroflexota bacterium]